VFSTSDLGISEYYLQYHRFSLGYDQVARTPLDEVHQEEDLCTKIYMQMVKAWPSRVFRGYAYQQQSRNKTRPPVRARAEAGKKKHLVKCHNPTITRSIYSILGTEHSKESHTQLTTASEVSTGTDTQHGSVAQEPGKDTSTFLNLSFSKSTFNLHRTYDRS
jgi:hypothetical protein